MRSFDQHAQKQSVTVLNLEKFFFKRMQAVNLVLFKLCAVARTLTAQPFKHDVTQDYF